LPSLLKGRVGMGFADGRIADSCSADYESINALKTEQEDVLSGTGRISCHQKGLERNIQAH
jgi:hypothetical protein